MTISISLAAAGINELVNGRSDKGDRSGVNLGVFKESEVFMDTRTHKRKESHGVLFKTPSVAYALSFAGRQQKQRLIPSSSPSPPLLSRSSFLPSSQTGYS